MTADRAVYPSYAVLPSPHPWQASNDVTLVALGTATRFCGLFVKYTAQRWGCHYLADDAGRVAVELIARAVETTGNPDPHPRYTELLKNSLPLIGVRVSLKGNGLLVEVWDSGPTPPHDAYLDSHLSVVEEISQGWSCYQPRGGGKVIWAELAVPEQQRHARQTFGGCA